MIVKTGVTSVGGTFNIFLKGLIDKAINGGSMGLVKIIQRSLDCKKLLYFVCILVTV